MSINNFDSVLNDTINIPNLNKISNKEMYNILEDENKRDAKIILKESERLLEISDEINRLLEESSETVISTKDIINKAEERLDNIEEIISEAQNYNLKSNKIKTIIGSTIIGVCIGGPVGGILGAQISTIFSTICGISGLILGGGLFGTISSKIINYKIYKSRNKTD